MSCASLFFLLTTSVVAATADALVWNQLPRLPDPLGVAAPFAGVSKGALLVAGGANFPDKMPWEGGRKVWHDRVWILDNPEGPWREAGRLPRPLAYGISVTWRDRIICVGGSDADRHHQAAFRLSWQDDAIKTEPLPPLPIALSAACGALVGDVLYVACGAEEPGEQRATNRAFSLDLAAPSPAWRELPALPGKPRILAAAAARDGAFYVLGGAALEPNGEGKIGRVYLSDAWCYQPRPGWQRLADLPKAVAAAPSPAPVIAGRILLIAGDDGSRAGFQPIDKHPGFAPAVFAFDPALDRWSEAGQTPAPRATAPTAEWRNRWVIPSGETRPGVRSPEVWSIEAR